MDNINEEHAGPHAHALELDEDIIVSYLNLEVTMMPTHRTRLLSAVPYHLRCFFSYCCSGSSIVSRHSHRAPVHSGLVSSSSLVATVNRHSLQCSSSVLIISVNNSLTYWVHIEPAMLCTDGHPFNQILTCEYNVQLCIELPAHLLLLVNSPLTHSVHLEPAMSCIDGLSFS